jgi:DNA-binding CsgD family transcriptional regulator
MALDVQEPRFTMLETVREFALERLAASGEAESIARAHAAYVLDLAERAELHLLGPDEQQWHARLDAELGNLRLALAWSLDHHVETALRIGAALWAYWAWYQLAEGHRWLVAVLARSPPRADPIHTKALIVDGALAALEGNGRHCLESGGRALNLARMAGDVAAEALAGWIVACGHLIFSEFQAAAESLDEALLHFDQATTSTSRAWAAYARSHRGAVALMLGDTKAGVAFYEEALARARLAGSDGLLLTAISDFAGWLIDLGETHRARPMLREALALAEKVGGIWLIASALLGLALVDAVSGEAASAARRLGACEAIRVLGGLAAPAQFQFRIDRTTALTLDALGEEAYATAWAAGYADPDAVVDAALGRQSVDPTADIAIKAGFTRREREVLSLLINGLSDKEIAEALFVARPTASKHVAAILAKLGVDSRTAAVSVALRGGLD